MSGLRQQPLRSLRHRVDNFHLERRRQVNTQRGATSRQLEEMAEPRKAQQIDQGHGRSVLPHQPNSPHRHP